MLGVGVWDGSGKQGGGNILFFLSEPRGGTLMQTGRPGQETAPMWACCGHAVIDLCECVWLHRMGRRFCLASWQATMHVYCLGVRVTLAARCCDLHAAPRD